MAAECPKCKGRGLMTISNGRAMASCSSCGGMGTSNAFRNNRAKDNRAAWIKGYHKKKAEIDELQAAIEQFKIKTNLDGVLLEAAKEQLRTLNWRLMDYAPRNLKKEELNPGSK